MHTDNLTDKEFPGIVIPEKDVDKTDHPDSRGRYKVYIPNHMQHQGLKSVIWAKNHTHKYRYGINEYVPGKQKIFGQYFPIQIGARVIIKFFSNNIESAFIDRIISDYAIKTMPFNYSHLDQSDITILLRTAEYTNVIAALENIVTDPLIKNSLHIYYHDDQVRIIMDRTGMHTWVEKQQNNWIKFDQRNQILMGQHNDITMYQRTLVTGKKNTFVVGNRGFLTAGIDEHRAGAYYAIDAPFILLNCGVATPMPVMPLALLPPRAEKSIKSHHLHHEYPRYEVIVPELQIGDNF